MDISKENSPFSSNDDPLMIDIFHWKNDFSLYTTKNIA